MREVTAVRSRQVQIPEGRTQQPLTPLGPITSRRSKLSAGLLAQSFPVNQENAKESSGQQRQGAWFRNRRLKRHILVVRGEVGKLCFVRAVQAHPDPKVHLILRNNNSAYREYIRRSLMSQARLLPHIGSRRSVKTQRLSHRHEWRKLTNRYCPLVNTSRIAFVKSWS